MRLFDLKRTGKLYEYVQKYNAQAAEIDAVQNFTTEVNSTTGFWQNPGY